MAAREKVFAPLPPAHGRAFARTWWGHEWLKALEDTALDAEQLGRAGSSRDRALSVRSRCAPDGSPQWFGDGPHAHRADVLLRELTVAEWERMLDDGGTKSGHIAALCSTETCRPAWWRRPRAVGVELLPGIGDLDPSCDCEAWDHCPHTTALCYQMARLLERIPSCCCCCAGARSGSCSTSWACAARRRHTTEGGVGTDGRGGRCRSSR